MFKTPITSAILLSLVGFAFSATHAGAPVRRNVQQFSVKRSHAGLQVNAKAPSKPAELLHDLSTGSESTYATQIQRVHEPRARLVWMEVTAYCPCPKCCGPDAAGVTASGKSIDYNQSRFVAADTEQLPFGTQLIIPGYSSEDAPVEVIDRGGAIKGNRLDVFFPTHEEALQWGRKHIAVTVIE